MEVILLADVKSLGLAGEIVKVKDGYARNFLFPNNQAMECTKSNRRMVEEQRRILTIRKAKEKEEYVAMAEKIAALSCTISSPSGEEDKLFGSVTNADIQKTLQQEGFAIDKRKIMLEEPIKKLGVYSVDIQLHPEVKATLKVWVVKE